jgi:hypothetical protein
MPDGSLRQTFTPEDGSLTEAPAGPPRARPRPFKVVSPPVETDGGTALHEASLAESWGGLIEQIRGTATRLREKEARLQEREDQLQQLVLRTKEELQVAAERVLRAEIQAHEVEAQTKREIADWERRTLAAEEKVRLMEGWLARVHDTIVNEFN